MLNLKDQERREPPMVWRKIERFKAEKPLPYGNPRLAVSREPDGHQQPIVSEADAAAS